jgi:hypothetical protein
LATSEKDGGMARGVALLMIDMLFAVFCVLMKLGTHLSLGCGEEFLLPKDSTKTKKDTLVRIRLVMVAVGNENVWKQQ